MPDGRILWSSNRSGPFEIWIAEADGSGARQLTKDGLSAQNPTATPDGKWIIYASGNPAHRGIWKIRPDGSGAVRLVTATVVIPEVSPDGQYVTYLTNRRTPMASVRVATVADGRDVPFSIAVGSQGRGGSFFTTGRTRWMPDGKAIAYIGQNESGHYGVYVQDFIPGRDTDRLSSSARGLRRGHRNRIICVLSGRKMADDGGLGTALEHHDCRGRWRSIAAAAQMMTQPQL